MRNTEVVHQAVLEQAVQLVRVLTVISGESSREDPAIVAHVSSASVLSGLRGGGDEVNDDLGHEVLRFNIISLPNALTISQRIS